MTISPATKAKCLNPWLAEDLPLNVSRETLQSSAFLKQIRNFVIRRLLQLFAKIAEGDLEKFHEITSAYNTVLKLGAAEDSKSREKIAALTRYTTNQGNGTSLDSVREPMWKVKDAGLTRKFLSTSAIKNKGRTRFSTLLIWVNLPSILQAVFSWRSSMREVMRSSC